ncbi:peptidoglycan recognition protein family protein, partial [Clostridium gasigenes]
YEMVAEGITVHNTANDASANNEVSYMRNNDKEVSFTYAVDDIEIVQGLLANRNGWHSGDGGNGYGNRKTISIEICYSKSGGPKFDKAEENAADLIAMLLKQNGWGINKVYTHMYFDRYKKYCPARTMDKGWNRFINMIKARLNGTVIPSTPSPIKPTPSAQLYRIRRSWADVASQKGAYRDINNAISCCPGGFCVFDVSGNKVFPSNTTQSIPKPSVQQPTQSNKFVFLKPCVSKWNVYPTNVAPVSGNQCGALAPSLFGGIEYEVLGNPETDVYTISTQSFGIVNIYIPVDEESSFYNKGVVTPISQPTVPVSNLKYLNLASNEPSWRVYPLGGNCYVGNEVGQLAPQQFGGLSYRIEKDLGNEIYQITTGSFGTVLIVGCIGNGGSITNSPAY